MPIISPPISSLSSKKSNKKGFYLKQKPFNSQNLHSGDASINTNRKTQQPPLHYLSYNPSTTLGSQYPEQNAVSFP